MKEPRAELISWTQNPIETIYAIWMKSKNSEYDMNPEKIAQSIKEDLDGGFLKRDVVDVFRKVIKQQIPVSENIDFVFMLHDDPISHREQMVRHRIGVHYGDNFGVDIIPDLADSTWWSQSMRIMDMTKFAEDEKYFIPQSVKDNYQALSAYKVAMDEIAVWYKGMLDLGIPMEDARNLLPLGTTMDISWKVNLASLIHIVGKRSCWILQYGLWSYIIKSMIDELCTKVDPIFREIVLPPCFGEGGKFHECVFKHENERRVSGEDKLPVCSLYHHNHMDLDEKMKYAGDHDDMKIRMTELAEKYSELWDKDAYTGEDI